MELMRSHSRDALGGDVLPGLRVVAGEVDQAVVGARPQDPLLHGGLGEGEDGVVDLHAGDVDGDGPAGLALLGGVVAGEVGGDLLPRLALIGAAHEDLGRVVEIMRLVARHDDGRVPLEAVPEVPGGAAVGELRPAHDLPRLAGAVVVAGDLAAVLAAEDDVGVAGHGGEPAALAAAHGVPVAGVDGVAGDAGGDGDAGVVLLGAVDPVGEAVVGGDPVELRGGLVVLGGPGGPAVEGDGGAAVVAHDHARRVVGVDPQVVAVAVEDGHGVEGDAAVGGLVQLDVGHPDGAGVRRVGVDPGVVPGALAELVLVVDVRPGGAVVVADEQAAARGLDHGVDEARLGPRGGHAHAAPDALGQPLGELRPGVAAVGGAPQRAAGPAGDELPRVAHDLPEAGVEDAGVGRVHGEVRGAGALVHFQDLLPGGAAVGGAIDAALGVGAPHVAQGGDVDEVGVGGVDADAGDLLGGGEAPVRPGAAGVGRAVDAVAGGDVAADGRLAHAGVDDVGVGAGDGDGAHGAGLEEAVGDRVPGGAAVGGLPHAAAGAAEVEGHGLAADAGDGDGAAAAIRADAAEVEAGELLGEGGRGLRRGRRGLRRRGGGGGGCGQDGGNEHGRERTEAVHLGPLSAPAAPAVLPRWCVVRRVKLPSR